MRYNSAALNKILQKLCRGVLRKCSCKFLKFRRSVRDAQADHVIGSGFIETGSEFTESGSLQTHYPFLMSIKLTAICQDVKLARTMMDNKPGCQHSDTTSTQSTTHV